MNKVIKTSLLLIATGLMATACQNNDPHARGIAAGKEACDCYRLTEQSEIESCLSKIESENREFQNDTAYTNAMESLMLQCISDGVIDILNPMKVAKDTVKKAEEPTDSTKTK